MAALWVVMPVFNEEGSVRAVIDEWLPVLRAATSGDFTFCAINDGSRDGTLGILRAAEREVPELTVVDKPNSGHGQTCAYGYRLAVESGADWVMQIDSDGQCDPRWFAELWAARGEAPAVYGFRRTRDDGYRRQVISRIVSVVTLLGVGVWVRDANVPYRLMSAASLDPILPLIPPDFHLTNILVAALQVRYFRVRWIDIGFRRRTAGVASVKRYAFAQQAVRLLRQLRAARRTMGGVPPATMYGK